MTDTTPKTAGVIAPPPILLVVSLIFGFGLSAAAPLGILAAIPVAIRYAVGGVICVSAFALALSAVTRFGQARTPVNPYYPPTQLVTSGVFAFVRNPMYAGFYILSTGLAIAFAADWLIATTVILAIVIHYGVVAREERFLVQKFGDDYVQYRDKVRRYGVV